MAKDCTKKMSEVQWLNGSFFYLDITLRGDKNKLAGK
jgi:hypothetical protein